MTGRIWILGFLLAPAAMAQTVASLDDQYFESDGVHIRYIEQGSGTPVLLIHGFAVPNLESNWIRSPAMKPEIIAELAQAHRVIAFDCRGHGKSDKPHDPQAYGLRMMEDVVRLMDHLEIRKAHVIGYSMGSMIGMKLLATHPERLLSMTLAGGAGVFRPDESFVSTSAALAASLREGKGIGPLLIAIAPDDKPKPTPAQAAISSALILAGQDQTALSCVVSGIRELETSEAELRRNQIRTLVIYGSRDSAAIRTVERVRGVLASAEYRSIANGDHVSTLANEEFRRALREFVSK